MKKNDVFTVTIEDMGEDGAGIGKTLSLIHISRALFVLSSGKVGFVETVPDLFQGIL